MFVCTYAFTFNGLHCPFTNLKAAHFRGGLLLSEGYDQRELS